jgi:hypothetical protein
VMGCRQVNGEWRVPGAVVSGVWKKCENLLKKKGRQIFSDGKFWRVVCVVKKGRHIFRSAPLETNFPYALGGGAKFISSPWAQKWLATALAACNAKCKYSSILTYGAWPILKKLH